MLEFLDKIPELFGNAIASEFTHTAAIFSLAALLHAKQVRKEIKIQFESLITVVKQDLDAQKTVLAKLAARVDNLETKLKQLK